MGTITALVLLPIEYNPDKKGKRAQITIREFQKTCIEIEKLFQIGCSIDPNPKYGIWAKKGIIFEDINVSLEINLFPEVKKEQLIEYCRNKLLKRFKQKAILTKFIGEKPGRPSLDVVLIERKENNHDDKSKEKT